MSSNRGLTNRKAISNSIDKRLHELFIELHKNTGKHQSRLLDEAIYMLLLAYNQEVDKELEERLSEAKNRIMNINSE